MYFCIENKKSYIFKNVFPLLLHVQSQAQQKLLQA